jgi:putative SOS response-associated peptidase YedK
MCFAGIWDVWGDGLNSFSIITQPATGNWLNLFTEMPLILDASQFGTWLHKGTAGKPQSDILTTNSKAPLEYYAVQASPLQQGVNDASVLEPYSTLF